MKTGTTFLQHVMIANQDRLAAAGYLFPGDGWGEQVRAVQDVGGSWRRDPEIRAEAAGAWKAMSSQMLDHPGTASVLSMEFLSFANSKRAARIVSSLHPAQVHIILTVRDATATLPAGWQTTVHNGSTVSWPEYMRGVRKAAGVAGRFARFSRNPACRAFARTQGIPHILDNWRPLVPSGRLHVVTVPPYGSDTDLLWERFASVLGVDPGVCLEPPTRANTSLGYASTELIRRVNQQLGRLRPMDYNPTLKQYLALEILAQRSRSESRARLDRATTEFGLAWNRRVRQAISASDADVIGDLADLPTEWSNRQGRYVEDNQSPPADREVLDAAVTAVEAMHRQVRRRASRLSRQGIEVDLARDDAVPVAPDRWDEAADPVAAAAAEIADLARTAIELRRRLTGAP